MLLVDTLKKVLVRDEELKLEIARLRPVKVCDSNFNKIPGMISRVLAIESYA